ncbi:MAG: hypothetical protein ABEK17_02275 [Candidatus Aenigmatarchaeota archaeon]
MEEFSRNKFIPQSRNKEINNRIYQMNKLVTVPEFYERKGAVYLDNILADTVYGTMVGYIDGLLDAKLNPLPFDKAKYLDEKIEKYY